MKPAIPLHLFLEVLRQDGFSVGVEEHVALKRILCEEVEWDLNKLKSVARTMLTKSMEEQARFNQIFDQFWTSPVAASVVEPKVPRRFPRWKKILLGTWLCGCLLAGIYWVWPESIHDVNSASDTDKDDFAHTGQPDRKSTGIDTEIEYETSTPEIDTVHYWSSTDAEDALTDTGNPPIDTDWENTQKEIPSPPPHIPPTVASQTRGYLASLNIWQRTIGAILAALLLTGLLLLLLRRIERRRYPRLDSPQLFSPEYPHSFPVFNAHRLEQTAEDLSWRHTVEAAHELDVARTVALTAKNAGIPHVAYNKQKHAPEYLVLVDAEIGNGYLSTALLSYVGRLSEHGVQFTSYSFFGAPLVCFSDSKATQGQSLNQILSKSWRGVLVFGDPDNIYNPLSEAVAVWARMLAQIPSKVWLYPEPAMARSYGVGQLSRLDFTTNPVDFKAFSWLSDSAGAPGNEAQFSKNNLPHLTSHLTPHLSKDAYRLLQVASVLPQPTIDGVLWLGEKLNMAAPAESQLPLWGMEWFARETWPVEMRARLINQCKSEEPELYRKAKKHVVGLWRSQEPDKHTGAWYEWHGALLEHTILHSPENAATVFKQNKRRPVVSKEIMRRSPVTREWLRRRRRSMMRASVAVLIASTIGLYLGFNWEQIFASLHSEQADNINATDDVSTTNQENTGLKFKSTSDSEPDSFEASVSDTDSLSIYKEPRELDSGEQDRAYLDPAPVTPAERCKQGDRCKQDGLCVFRNGRCMATAKSCKQSIGCKKNGKCVVKNGKCTRRVDDSDKNSAFVPSDYDPIDEILSAKERKLYKNEKDTAAKAQLEPSFASTDDEISAPAAQGDIPRPSDESDTDASGANQNSEVRQPGTKLYWLRCPVGQNWNGSSCSGKAREMTWYEAKSACPSGYRLPTRQEFVNLLGGCDKDVHNGDYGDCNTCGKNSNCRGMFTLEPGWYWSSSPDDGGNAWGASFAFGWLSSHNVGFVNNVRCVRQGP